MTGPDVPPVVALEVGVLEGYTVALTIEPFHELTARWWHAWAPDGSYAGQSNNPVWLGLLIAQHRHTTTS